LHEQRNERLPWRGAISNINRNENLYDLLKPKHKTKTNLTKPANKQAEEKEQWTLNY